MERGLYIDHGRRRSLSQGLPCTYSLHPRGLMTEKGKVRPCEEGLPSPGIWVRESGGRSGGCGGAEQLEYHGISHTWISVNAEKEREKAFRRQYSTPAGNMIPPMPHPNRPTDHTLPGYALPFPSAVPELRRTMPRQHSLSPHIHRPSICTLLTDMSW